MTKIKPYLLNWIYNNAKKGAKPPKLEEKSVTITENGLAEVVPSEGYDGLSKVNIETNVPTTDLSEYFSSIRLTGNTGQGINILKKIPNGTLLDTSTSNNMSSIFQNAFNLKEVGTILNTNNITNISTAFYHCDNLESIALFDTSNVTNMMNTFARCFKLCNIPLFNTSKVTNFQNTFLECNSLNNNDLNTIMQMCINATSYTGTKTLTKLGLNVTQIATCQTLSNWNDFVNAGWSA